MDQPSEDWQRLASYVVSARLAAGYKTRQALAAASGVTERTLSKLENGHRVSPDTLAAVEALVGWRPDSARITLAGGEPVPTTPEAMSAGRELDSLATLSPADWGALTDDERDIARAFIDNLRRIATERDAAKHRESA